MSQDMSQIKKLLEAVDNANKIYDVLVGSAMIILPFGILSSPTLRSVVAGSAFLGGALGYYFTVSRWAGRGMDDCLYRRNIYFLLLWIPLVIAVMTAIILEPALVEQFPRLRLRGIREFLLTAMLLPNLIIGLGMFFLSYLLIGAISLNSPKLWAYRLT